MNCIALKAILAFLVAACAILPSSAFLNRGPIGFNKIGSFRGPNNKFGSTGGNSGDGGATPPPPSSSGSDDDKNDNPLKSFWKGYNAQLEENPILIKALTSCVGFSIGDFLAQKFISKEEEFDFKRLIKLASFGLLLHGTTGHFFYGFLDGKLPGTAPLTVFTKVAIDQLIWNPIFGVIFFGYNGLFDGKDFNGIKQEIEDKLMTSVTGSWTVWPLAHLINFRFIPSEQRLLYINSIQIGYNMFLSVISSSNKEEPAVAE